MPRTLIASAGNISSAIIRIDVRTVPCAARETEHDDDSASGTERHDVRARSRRCSGPDKRNASFRMRSGGYDLRARPRRCHGRDKRNSNFYRRGWVDPSELGHAYEHALLEARLEGIRRHEEALSALWG